MRQRRERPLAVVSLVGFAVFLRCLWLGRLGLRGDEDISTLAIRGILAEGVPRLPSGEMYSRGIPYHYLAAPWALVTAADWFPRAFSVLLSGLTLAAIIHWGQQFVGRRPALLGGFFFAVSLLEIDLARQIRFYALYQLLAFVVLVLAYRAFEQRSAGWAWCAAATIVIASSAHMLGATLPALLAPSAPRLFRSRSRILWLLAFVLSSGPVLWAVFVLPRGASVAEEVATASSPPFFKVALLLGASGVALVMGCVGSKGAVWAQALRGGAWAAVAGLAVFGSLGTAWVFLVCALLMEREWGRAGSKTVYGFVLLLFLISLPHAFDALVSTPSLRRAVGVLGGDTIRLFRGLASWPWLISGLALFGSSVVGWRLWRDSVSEGPRFLLLALLICLGARGLIAPRPAARYLADLWPAWELLAGWGTVQIHEWVKQHVPSPRAAARGAALAFAAAVALAPGTSVHDIYHYLRLKPGEPNVGPLYPPFVPDWRSVAAWLQPRVRPGERIAATDWLTAYCYLGRVDFWLRSGAYEHQAKLGADGIYRDQYLAAEVVRTPEELLSRAAQGPIWIVAGGLELEIEDEWLAADLRQWLLRQEALFVAPDGRTRVIHLNARRALVSTEPK